VRLAKAESKVPWQGTMFVKKDPADKLLPRLGQYRHRYKSVLHGRYPDFPLYVWFTHLFGSQSIFEPVFLLSGFISRQLWEKRQNPIRPWQGEWGG